MPNELVPFADATEAQLEQQAAEYAATLEAGQQIANQVAQQQQQQNDMQEISTIFREPASYAIIAKARDPNHGLTESEQAAIPPKLFEYIYNPSVFKAKYGNELSNQIEQLVAEYHPEGLQDNQSLGEWITDNGIGFVQGLGRDIGGLAAMAVRYAPEAVTSFIPSHVGQYLPKSIKDAYKDIKKSAEDTSLSMSRYINGLSESIDKNLKSDFYRQAKDLEALRRQASKKLIDYQDQKNAENGDSEFMRTAKRIGNEIFTWGRDLFLNPNALTSGVSENSASILLSFGMGGALTKGANLATKAAPFLSRAGGTTAGKVLQKVVTPEMIINGLLEAGGTRNEAINKIDSMTPEQLRSSEQFTALEKTYQDQGLEPLDAFFQAKNDFAKQAADYVTKWAGITGAITGRISPATSGNVSKLMRSISRNPLRAAKNVASGTVKETTQEAIEEGSEARGMNQAQINLGYNVNPWEDVIENATKGGITGGVMGGGTPLTLSTISSVKHITDKTAKLARNLTVGKPVNEDEINSSKSVVKNQEELAEQFKRDYAGTSFSKYKNNPFTEAEPVVTPGDAESQKAHDEWEKHLESWVKTENKQRKKLGLLSVEEEMSLKDLTLSQDELNKREEDFIKANPKNEERLEKTQMQEAYSLVQDALTQSKDTFVGRKGIEAKGSPFVQQLQKISGRDDITDESAEIFDDNKTLVENYTAIASQAKKLHKKGKDREAVQMLQDAQAMAEFGNTVGDFQQDVFNKKLIPGFLAAAPDVVPLMESTLQEDMKQYAKENFEINVDDNASLKQIYKALNRKDRKIFAAKAKELEKQRQQTIDNLPAYSKGIFNLVTKYVQPANALQAGNRLNAMQASKNINFTQQITDIIKNSDSLKSWFKEQSKDITKLSSAPLEDQMLFHTMNQLTLFDQDIKQQSPEERKATAEMLKTFIADNSLDKNIREFYKRVLPTIEMQEKSDFLKNQVREDRIGEIHKDLTTSKRTPKTANANNRGFGTEIPQHFMQVIDALNQVKTYKGKKNLSPGEQAAYNQVKKDLQNRYNAAYGLFQSQRNKYYALYAAKALAVHNRAVQDKIKAAKEQQFKQGSLVDKAKFPLNWKKLNKEKIGKEHKKENTVRYNSLSYDELGNAYWSEQNTTGTKGQDYRKSVFFNLKAQASQDLADATEYEIKTLQSLLNAYHQDIADELGEANIPSLEYEEGLFNNPITPENAKDIYEKYQQLAKEQPAQTLQRIKKNTPSKPKDTSSTKTDTPAKPKSFAERAKETANKLFADSELNDFKAISEKGLKTITYQGKAILNKTGTQWKNVLPASDFAEVLTIDDSETNHNLDILFSYLFNQQRKQEQGQQNPPKKDESTKPQPKKAEPKKQAEPKVSTATESNSSTGSQTDTDQVSPAHAEAIQRMQNFINIFHKNVFIQSIVKDRKAPLIGYQTKDGRYIIEVTTDNSYWNRLYNQSNRPYSPIGFANVETFAQFEILNKANRLVNTKAENEDDKAFAQRMTKRTLWQMQNRNMLPTSIRMSKWFFSGLTGFQIEEAPKNNGYSFISVAKDKKIPSFKLTYGEYKVKNKTDKVKHLKFKGVNIALSPRAIQNTIDKTKEPKEVYYYSDIQNHIRNAIRGILLKPHTKGGTDFLYKDVFTTDVAKNKLINPYNDINNLLWEITNLPEFEQFIKTLVQQNPELNFIHFAKSKQQETSVPKQQTDSAKNPAPKKPDETESVSRIPLGTKETPLLIYSDGSDIKGTGNIGYGAVFEHNGKQYVISGTNESDGVKALQAKFPNAKFSNPTMEMVALTATLETIANLNIPEHIQIRQDYKGAVNYGNLWNYSEGSEQRAAKPWKAREDYIKYLVDRAEKAIAKIEQNGGSVSIRWVKGHSGSKMNDAADAAAKSREIKNTFAEAYQIASEQPSTPSGTPKPSVPSSNTNSSQNPPKKDSDAKKQDIPASSAQDITDTGFSEKQTEEWLGSIIDEYLELNKDKTYNRDKRLEEYFDNTNKENLKKRILQRMNKKDLALLNNPFYFHNLITDFLDLKENNNPKRTVYNTSYALHTVLPQLIPSLSNGYRLSREIKSHSKEKPSEFVEYFTEEWNKRQKANDQDPYRNNQGMLDDIVSIAENYQPKKKMNADEFSAPEEVSQLLQTNNIEPEQVSLDTLYTVKNNALPIQKLAVKSIRNAFGSLVKDNLFRNKHNLLNYAKSPKELLHSLLNQSVTALSKGESAYWSALEKYNKNAGNLKNVMQKLDKDYKAVSNENQVINLKEALQHLYFDKNSLSNKIYAELEKAYTSPNVYTNNLQSNSKTWFLAYDSNAVRRMMLNQNRKEDGTSESSKNRTFWLTLNEQGQPILNRHLAEKAILGALNALTQNPTSKLNINMEMDDIDEMYPDIQENIKQTMARSLSSPRLLAILENGIRSYTDLAFKDSIDVATEKYLINSIATDILRILENEGLFTKHWFVSMRQAEETTYSSVQMFHPKKDETMTQFYGRLKGVDAKLKEKYGENGKIIWQTYFEFTPGRQKFYKNLSEQQTDIMESFNLLGTVAPDLLDTFAQPTISSTILIGNEGELPVDTTQRHLNIALPKSQQDNLRRRQNQKFYLNPEMYSIAKVLVQNKKGNDNYADILLDRVDLTPDNKDVLDSVRETIEGQKLASENSVTNMTGLLSRLLVQAGEKDGKQQSIKEIPLRFKYGIIRMNRLSLEGYNPQSDKMFRELFLPKATQINLADTNSINGKKIYNIFLRAVLQSFGEKIQYEKSGQDYQNLSNMSLEQGLNEEQKALQQMLTAKFEPDLDNNDIEADKKRNFLKEKAVQDYQKLICSDTFIKAMESDTAKGLGDSSLSVDDQKIILNFIPVLREYLQSDSSWIALHGVTEYLRYHYYLNHDQAALKNFTTQLYLEADGIASGASNSIYLFSTIPDYAAKEYVDPFTNKKQKDFTSYKFMLRAGGGFGITGSFGSIMSQTNQSKNDDIYGSIANSLKRELSSLMTDAQYQTNINVFDDSKGALNKKQQFVLEKVKEFDSNAIQKIILPLQNDITKSLQTKKEKAQFSLVSKGKNDKFYSTSIANLTYNLLALYGSLVPTVSITSMGDLQDGFKIKRNWIKSPLTKYNYGAGTKSIATGLVQGNNLYPGIVNAYIEKLTAYNLEKNAKAKEKLAKELKQITFRIMLGASFTVTKDLQGSYARDHGTRKMLDATMFDNFKELLNALEAKKNIPTDWTFDPRVFLILQQNTDALISSKMSKIITEEMYGTEFAANKAALLAANSLMSLVYSSLYIDRSLQEVLKKQNKAKQTEYSKDADLATRLRWLTKAEQKKIDDELKEFAPLYKHSLNVQPGEHDADTKEMLLDADFLALKNGKLDEILAQHPDLSDLFAASSIKSRSVIAEKDTQEKNLFNTYASTLKLNLPMDSGVLFLPQSVITMAEASIMHIMAAGEKIGLDVFDGFNMPVGLVASLGSENSGIGEAANKAVYEIWSQSNVYNIVGKHIDEFYRKLYNKDAEQTPYADLFHSNLAAEPGIDKEGNPDFTKLNMIQEAFVKNALSMVQAMENTAFGKEILQATGLVSVLDSCRGMGGNGFDRAKFAKTFLPIESQNKNNAEEHIKALFFGIRSFVLKADQAIQIKQALLNGFTDFSVDQMGGAATPYIHTAKAITYTDKASGKQKTIEPIKTYNEMKQKNPSYTYEQYLDEVFVPKYLSAFRTLEMQSKEFDFLALAKNTIADNFFTSNDAGKISAAGKTIAFHTVMRQKIAEAIKAGSQVENANAVFDPDKEIRIYSIKDALQYIQKRLSGTRFDRRAVALKHLLNIFKHNQSILADYKITMPSEKFMDMFLSSIGNDAVKQQFENFFKKNDISVDYYTTLTDQINDTNKATSYGITTPQKVIAIFRNNIYKRNLDYNDILVTTMLHEITHAYLQDYLANNVIALNDGKLQIVNPKALKAEERVSLQHLINMFEQYKTVSTQAMQKDVRIAFNEFIAKVMTRDYSYERELKENPDAFAVPTDKTLATKLKSIISKAKESLKKLLTSILGSSEVANVFSEAQKATEILMRSSDFFGKVLTEEELNKKTDTLFDSAILHARAYNQTQKFNQVLQEKILKESNYKDLPTELALVDDNGNNNQQVNQELHNIASLLKLTPEQNREFTTKAKEIYALLQDKPEQLTDAIQTLQEFYKQLSDDKLMKIALQNSSNVQDVQDIIQILKDSFADLAKNNMHSFKQHRHIGHSFSMSIPSIIALNEVSPLMQEITNGMTYSLLRNEPAQTMNQKIRDIAHNLYMRMQGKSHTQYVGQQLQNIQEEGDMNMLLSFLNYTPSVNPALNKIDDQFNRMMDMALSYVARRYDNSIANTLLPIAFRGDSLGESGSYDLFLANKSTDNLIVSLLNEMLPSSNYKKKFYLLRKQAKSALDQERQDYRTARPNHIRNLFKNTYSKTEWKSITRSVGHTDLASLSNDMRNEAFTVLKQHNNRSQSFNRLAYQKAEDAFALMQKDFFQSATDKKDMQHLYPLSGRELYTNFIEPLAQYLATGQIIHPTHFYKNAYSIGATLFGSWYVDGSFGTKQQTLEQLLNEAATFGALSYLEEEDLNTLEKVVRQDEDALNKTINNIQELMRNEESKIDPLSLEGINAKLNAWKGYMPTSTMAGSSIILGRESDREMLTKRGFKYLKSADTVGTNLNELKVGGTTNKTINDPLAYYYTNLPRQSMFNEGIYNIALPSYFGSNRLTNYTIDNPQLQTIGTIIDEGMEYIQEGWNNRKSVVLIPIRKYNTDKGVVDESIAKQEMFINDLDVLKKLEYQDYLPEMIGFWGGRQKEEEVATQFNITALNLCLEAYSPSQAKNFVNILDPKQLTPVQRDAVEQIPWNIRMLGSEMFKNKYGKEGIFIRKDLLRDAIGQRSASVMDLYNGISNLDPKTQKLIKTCLEKMMGKHAYAIAVGAEQAIQGLTSVARNMIVIKSVKVMILNNFGNIWHLMAIGVPFKFIIAQIPKLLKESETYAQYGFEYQKLLVERDAVSDPNEKKKIQAQIDMLDNKIKSLSIAPILSEFSSINDLGLDTEDLDLMRGAMGSWVVKQINRLPSSMVVAGKHILMTKDTPQYQFLEKATQYGDFIAKGILYNYMTQVQKKTHDEARYRILDEFVNYDQLAGRTRAYLESMALLWFFNYKLRIMKVAIRLLQNNPFRAMLMLYTNQWSPAGPAGNVLEDSILGKIISGDLGFTMGPGMLLRGLTMHPLLELLF